MYQRICQLSQRRIIQCNICRQRYILIKKHILIDAEGIRICHIRIGIADSVKTADCAQVPRQLVWQRQRTEHRRIREKTKRIGDQNGKFSSGKGLLCFFCGICGELDKHIGMFLLKIPDTIPQI